MNYTTQPSCHLCPLQGKNIVYGVGPLEPELMIIGEAPGAQESGSGIPFVGKAGELLRGILRDVGFKQVYYTNVIMCRPPGNRDPSKTEIKNCIDRLKSEIEHVKPKKILVCGSVANNAFGKNPQGVWTELMGIPTIYTVHPALCIRKPDAVNDLVMHATKMFSGEQVFPPPKWVVVDKIPKHTDGTKITIDLETTGLSPRAHKILWIGVLVNDSDTVFIIPPSGVDAQLLGWLEDPNCKVIMHNADFDAGWMMHHYGCDVNNIHDTMLLHYAADGRTGEEGVLRNLKKLAREYLDAPNWEGNIDRRKLAELPTDQVHEYLAHDVWATYLLEQRLATECTENGVYGAYLTVISPSIPTLAEMSGVGVKADVDHLYELKGKYETEVMQKTVDLCKIVGNDNFNAGSPKQIAEYMYDLIGYPQVNKRSTDKLTINALLDKHPDDPFLSTLMEYRFYSKFLSTYVNGMLSQIESDGRIHTHFLIPGTATGRLSSRNPNLQNVPTRMGPDIRNVFIADDGWMFADNDYSQLEVRVAAHVSGDAYLTNTFIEDRDIHRAVAAVLYGVPLEQVTKEQRQNAKNVGVFGVIYGISLDGFMTKLGLTDRAQAEYVFEYAKKEFSGLLGWVSQQHAKAVNFGYVESLFGRKRWFPIIDKWNLGEIQRQAANMPIQSAASDICLLSANKVRLSKREGVKLLILVHDSIVSLVREESDAHYIKSVMEDIPFESKVPFKAEIKMGKRWGEVKALE